ncbi:hypothetical protein DID88_009938 [Monilinia fructigena]|uniref:Uncharacterized protein n=1 Tax=Monilinia fructigena TaxID=38457 RepID=A0A395IK31_9HELO|nr:hypothetical protein DID88_009938 [Monilinia fructigena]
MDVANAQHAEPQHCGALPKRSAMDLVSAFVHDVECAFARKREVNAGYDGCTRSIRRAITPAATEEDARPRLACAFTEND